MSRISARFESLKAQGRKALIPYVTAGDPEPSTTVPLMHALVEAGADIIELGVPFSDPMADGPVIQSAMERALAHKVSLTDVLGMVREFRKQDGGTPVVLMGYLNPVERMGYVAFAQGAAEVGVDGVLTVDLPPEEAAILTTELRPRGLDAIFLLAPTTTDTRARMICAQASGYMYYVSLKGVTGSAALNTEAVAERLARLRTITDLPIGVGFGIRDGATAAAVAKVADGVVVGSALVRQFAEHAEPSQAMAAIVNLLKDMRGAMDR